MVNIKNRGLIAPIFLFFIFITSLNASFVIKNDNILPEKTVNKIEELGNELFKKTGVSVYLAAIHSLNGKTIKEYEENLSKNLNKPFILLTISINDKKIDIINSKELNNKFDKEQVLSPYPWSGTILPLLTAKSKNPKANIEAALLNGYADIVEQVANSYNVKLKSAIGSQNKIVYEILKILFYGIILLVLAKYMYGRIKRK
ncbi:TPM domain-containing protein [Nitrosophilus kaiyonis]|uniref:TPM domain-containing protein n=1 Tax=Nitrosophilus kaiyonis TaxID=2930200 RepID=UPI002490D055|nr:TPM domain-containing protein [Nitrosophilus kaiyonis]